MLTLVSIVHIIVALGLVMFVLLQDPKSGATGMFGGGASNSLFGATGATTILSTITKWLAVIFAITCLALTYLTSKKGGSLLDNYSAPAAAPPPVEAPATEGMETKDTGTPAEKTAPTEKK